MQVIIWFQVKLACGHYSPMALSERGNVRHPHVLVPAKKLLKRADACVHDQCKREREAAAEYRRHHQRMRAEGL